MINFFKKPIFSYGIFWSWNLIFLILLIFSQTETGFLYHIIKASIVGLTPIDYTIYSLLIFVIPIGSIILGFTKLRKEPKNLLRLFYGVEIPLTLLFVLRLFLFRELTLSTFHIFIILTIGLLSYLSEILIQPEKTKKGLQIFQKIGHSLLLIIGIYFSLVLVFYAIPLLKFLVYGFFTFEWLSVLSEGVLVFLFVLFFIYTATVLVVLPFGLIYYYISAFFRNSKIKIPNGKTIVFSVLSLNLFLLFFLNYSQPQQKSLELLKDDLITQETKVYFFEHSEEIKSGLLNAYLSPYRYISSIEDNNHIEEIYKEVFNLEKETALGVQHLYNYLMSPFLYRGKMYEDKAEAKRLYEKYFDGNIQKNEKESIVKSMKSTWDSDGIEAGLLNINKERVHINNQEITVKEKGNFAEIEIYEVYQNKTFTTQEIFYYFSLPENAVITGLWLSDEKDSHKKYTFTVSPRGAAQKVYKEQVRKRVDPSLLEQVGPNQYRLRAFPIEPKRKDFSTDNGRNRDYSYDVKEGNEFHLWLSYKTLKTEENTWELPKLNEKRNVYWSSETDFSINNQTITKTDSWLPKFIKASNHPTFETQYVRVQDSTFIKMEKKNLTDNLNIKTKNITILLDGSFSMNKERESINSLLKELDEIGYNSETTNVQVINNSTKVFNIQEFKKALQTNKALFFGSTTYMDMLNKCIINETDENSVLLFVSDKGNYELSKDVLTAIPFTSPLYILHLNCEQRPIYNDAFLETIQNSKGSIVNSIQELAEQLYLRDLKSESIISYKNGIMYSNVEDIHGVENTFINAIAVKEYISNLQIAEGKDRVKQLDNIHQIAFKEQIITLYSSMIVLVNEQQKRDLKKAEEADDRFDREVESGEETISKPFNSFNVTGTPEPHEWILMAIVFFFVLYKLYLKKKGLEDSIL